MNIVEKSITSNPKLYCDNSFIVFLLHTLFLLFPGIIIGHVIDRSIWYLKKNKKIGDFNVIYILIQVILNCIVLFILFNISPLYSRELQNTLAGIFFVALFFNMQIHFIINLQELFHIKGIDD